MTSPALVWLRNDLRLADNPALSEAVASGRPIIVLYVLEESGGPRPPGAAARWWLHHSLVALGRDLAAFGVPLVLRRGAARVQVPHVAADCGAAAVYWNLRYEPGGAAADADIRAELQAAGRSVESGLANLLASPHEVATGAGRSFRVYTPFAKALRARGTPRHPLPIPPLSRAGGAVAPESDGLEDWSLLPTKPNWAKDFAGEWNPGEPGANLRLDTFVEGGLRDYRDGRDFPALAAVSRLSPALRFGEISPYQSWHSVGLAAAADGRLDGSAEKFLSEILWREFSWHLLANELDISTANIQRKFDSFPWRYDADDLVRWQQGRTGYPLVDAGMRELWHTGAMHNRVRMVAASFLVKHLMIDWREGERWFWDTLVDADEASNPANWQWVAGTGADAAPYFRIFNPTLQREKFDPDGRYVRRWVPEWSPECVAGKGRRSAPLLAELEGGQYPAPVVDHDMARRRALDALAGLRPGEG
ncbi:MAG: deoxyribodipyrimidine photo-lyase [Hyphomicrobiales bacterium]